MDTEHHTKKEFHVSRKQKWIYGIFSTLFLFCLGPIIYSEISFFKNHQLFGAYFFGPTAFIVDLYCFIGMVYAILSEKITVTQDGFEYKFAPSQHISKKWGDVKRIGIQLNALRQIEGLYVRKSRVPEFSSAHEKLDFVPLSIFAENWRDSELGQQIKQYAPHLFAQDQENS